MSRIIPLFTSSLLLASCDQKQDFGRYQLSGDRAIDTLTGCVVKFVGVSGEDVQSNNPFNPDDKSCSKLTSPDLSDSRTLEERAAADRELKTTLEFLSRKGSQVKQ